LGEILKRNAIIINLVAAFLWMSMYSYVPTLPAYAMSLGATAAVVGAIGGAYGVMQIVLRVPLGIVSDKIGKDKLLLLVGFVILGVSALMFIFAKDNFWVLIARGVGGASAAWWVVICASYAKYNDEDKQVKAQGVLNASSNMGKVVAALAGGLLAQAFGLHAPFYFAFVAAIIGIGVILLFKTPKQTQKIIPPSGKELAALLKNKHLLIFSVLAIFSQLLCFALPSYFTSVAAKNLGADSAQLGLLMVVYFLVTSAASLFVGTKLYKKIGGIKCIAISFAIGAFSCLPMFYHMNLAAVYVMQGLSGICYGITCGALAGFVIKAVEPSQRSTATGILQSIFAIGIFLGPVIVGGVIEWVSFDAAFWVICILTAIAAVLSLLLIPREYDKM
ncbi:MAG: MFS transporter, partial [Christensenella sp.]